MKTTKRIFAYLTMIMLTAAVLFAQESKSALTKDEIGNLKIGINSENTGLKRSSIYFSGKYGIKETTEVLVERLKRETNAQDRILIALALYKIGGKSEYEAVRELAQNDYNPKVRRISNAICDAFEVENEKLLANLD